MTPYEYLDAVPANLKALASKLDALFNSHLPHCENKVWHSSPVWFDEGNPIVTYFVKKDRVFVMFWNGQNLSGSGLKPVGKYSAADIGFSSLDELNEVQMQAWLTEAKDKPQNDFSMRVKI
jgi:hypothetical protein